ncbi:MAG: MATE family efflux transporter, partial [Pseudomonadota bacterium]
VVSMIAALGVSAVLTRSYALTLTQILMIITFVISHGNQVLVGYDKGAGENEAALRRGQRTALITGAFAMGATMLFYLIHEPLLGILTQDPEILSSIAAILLLQVFVMPLRTVNLILFNSLKACGDVNRPVIASLLLTFGIA